MNQTTCNTGRRKFLSLLLLPAAGAAGAALKMTTRGQGRDAARPGSGSQAVGWDAGPIRRAPVAIPPIGDLAGMVPDDGLRDLLSNLAPSWYSFKTARVLHAFRLWGPHAVFPARLFTHPFESRVFSGAELAAYLLDHRAYRKTVPGEAPLLIRTPYGVTVRTYVADAIGNFAGGLAHNDDLLTACGEVDLPTDAPVYTPGGPATVGDMVRDTVARFTISQELEWSAEALARYLAPRRSWSNRFGEAFSFDDAAAALLRKTPGEGACAGIHVPYSLTCLYRIHEQHPILSGPTRDRIARYLKAVSLMVVAARQGAGHWSARWAPGVKAEPNPAAEIFTGVVSTGHHLEWIALAPPDLRPPRDSIGRAVRSVLGLVKTFTTYNRSLAYLELSHLGRALCLLKNRSATEAVQA